MSINEIIRKRRTIKPDDYLDKPIPAEILEDILENANWAPTHGMTEPWRFTVLQGDSRIELGESLQKLYKDLIPEDKFREDKYEKLMTNPAKSPVVICVSMQRQKHELIPEIEEIEAVACSVMNMYLSAAANGLGAFWSTPKIIYDDSAKSFLNLGEKDKWLGIFYMGYPSIDWPTKPRRPISDKIEWRN